MTAVNQVGIVKSEPRTILRRSEVGYVTHHPETAEYCVYLTDGTFIAEIAYRAGTYLAYDIDRHTHERVFLQSCPTITVALRTVFGKPDSGYSWYELAS